MSTSRSLSARMIVGGRGDVRAGWRLVCFVAILASGIIVGQLLARQIPLVDRALTTAGNSAAANLYVELVLVIAAAGALATMGRLESPLGRPESASDPRPASTVTSSWRSPCS